MPINAGEDKRRKISLICYSFPSFVRQDYEILSRRFDVDKASYRGIKDIPRIVSAILSSDLSFSWFAGGHAFLAVLLSKIFGKKSVVVAGGYDVAYIPEIDYGQFTQAWHKRMMTKFAINYADVVLSVSEFTKKEVLKWTRPNNIRTIYNGVDTARFGAGTEGHHEKENLVITVGDVNRSNLTRKGIETFVKSAGLVPEAQFIVAGRETDDSADYLRSIAPSNVKLVGFISDEELLELYRRAKVYVQISAYESFGMSLAEAMLCECVPVATDRGALPEVVGDTGFYVPYGDERATAEGIRRALESDKGCIARDRIKNLFTMDRRENEIVKAIEMIK
jgi:glycosyltransferase involved in cell wall biosynthesis